MRKRPAGATLLATLRRGDHVIISKVDRAYRDLEDALRGIRQLKERGVTAHFVDVPDLPDGAAGELVFGIIAMAAQFERRRIGERTKEALNYRRKNGQATCAAPLGWQLIGFKATARWIPDPEMRAVGDQVVAMREAGLRWWDIKQAMMAQGIEHLGDRTKPLLRTKEIYCRTRLRWPQTSLKLPNAWLFNGNELGLKALAALEDKPLEALLRNREKAREYIKAAWDAVAAEAVDGKQHPVLQQWKSAAPD